jgi:hypothetical protein
MTQYKAPQYLRRYSYTHSITVSIRKSNMTIQEGPNQLRRSRRCPASKNFTSEGC